MIHPDSAIGSTKKANDNADYMNAGLFWCNAKSVSTTQIVKVQTSLQQWSLETGMSKKSLEAGLSFSIGEVAVGTKFGFERERSSSSKTASEKSETHYTALHTIPAAQINLNETTVRLSPDAESDIKGLRKERKFTDLLAFFNKYGSSCKSSERLSTNSCRHTCVPEHHAWWTLVPYSRLLIRQGKF
jgi:hypothetical protein